MKKLFLTSIKLDYLAKMVDNKKEVKVAFVPTAADTYDDKWFVEADRKKFKEFGFSLIEVDLKNKTEEELFNAVKDVDIIYITGGNTFYLLEKVRESGFDNVVNRLIDKVIYAGSSAGAVLACPTIEPIKFLDDPLKAPNLKSYDGLGLVNFVIIPHYGKEKYKAKHDKTIKEYNNKKFKLILLTDEQSIIVEGNEYKIIENK